MSVGVDFGAILLSLILRSCLVSLLVVGRGVSWMGSLERGTSLPSDCSSWSVLVGNLIGEGLFFFSSFFLKAIITGDFLFFVGVSGIFTGQSFGGVDTRGALEGPGVFGVDTLIGDGGDMDSPGKFICKKNPLQDLLSSLNVVISTNETHCSRMIL